MVGPSGSGKTTLLNLIAGILTPEAGRIDVAGTEVSGLSDAERRRFRASRIGFVFQDFALLDYLSVRQNIYYPYRITPALVLDEAARDRAERLATACGIGDKLDRHPSALSQGEQQRVAICRALVTQPKLILSDEATGKPRPGQQGEDPRSSVRASVRGGRRRACGDPRSRVAAALRARSGFCAVSRRGGGMNALYLAFSYLRYHWARSLVLVARGCAYHVRSCGHANAVCPRASVPWSRAARQRRFCWVAAGRNSI